ncbi:MAG: rod shape-determining protein RodA [Actinomycetia bacterium]|nr:rod shape-determining protein RodA [Actinomycetes bacterium]
MTAVLSSSERERRRQRLPLRHLDWSLVILMVTISVVGDVLIYSATHGQDGTSFLIRQSVFIVIGVAVMLTTAFVDYRHLRDWSVLLYSSAVVSLVLVLVIGSENNGTKGWFELGSFTVQPSELAKPVVILALAAFVSTRDTVLDLRRIALALGLVGLPMMLILQQPDLGTVMVFAAITMGMLLVGGARPMHMVLLVAAGVLVVVGVLTSDKLDQYQRDRLLSFADPAADPSGDSYQQEQAQLAIGSGGLTGQGLFEGPQTQLQFVPEQQTDFIFVVAGEELGFVGGAAILGLWSLLLLRIFRTAQISRDGFGAMLCAGAISMFVFQIFQNVGMSSGILPITGIPLPLISYGGSSFLATAATLGLVLNVHMRRFS